MISNKVIKRKFVTNIVFLILGLLCAVMVVPLSGKVKEITQKSNAESIPFSQAYAEGKVSEEYVKENPYVAYIEIEGEPYEFAYYSDSERFAYVHDDNRLYLIRGSKSEMESLANAVASDGSARVMGAVKELDQEVVDMAYETYLEFGLDDPMTREEFDDYFGGMAIYKGYRTGASGNYAMLVLLSIVLGFIFLLIGIPGIISYLGGHKKLSTEEKELIAAELEDPRTVYIKQCHCFLTPRHLVYADNHFAVLPYEDIIWSYKYTFRYCFIPVYNCVIVNTRDRKKKRIAHMSVFVTSQDRILQQLFTEISAHNPVAVFGFTKEAQNYYYSGVWNNTQQSA